MKIYEDLWDGKRMVTIEDLYRQNLNFKGYVDHYRNNYSEGRSIPLNEALQHRIVFEIADYYQNESENNILVNLIYDHYFNKLCDNGIR